ncbi:hypothetical protein MBRA1_003643 [Malassezia brasiliensis]|uniref:Uncharacterized protein n=1 Tax=Malassezia brasiliensis TaxID=1821822 RepID=A0AAF0IQ20_9BASI|nr:hypothetical protein MBRA1_003643 [Malassezia brasiliensis]
MSDASSIATATTLVDVDLGELKKSSTLLEEPVLLVTRLRVRGCSNMPYLLTTPQGYRVGTICAHGAICDPQTRQFTRFDYRLLDADERPLLDLRRSGDLRQSDTYICVPGSDEVLARVRMQLAKGRRLYEVYDDRGAAGGVSQPFVSAEVRSSEEHHVFKNAAGEVMAGAENMYPYYTWMQRKLASPPTPYVLYYDDVSNVPVLQLPIKSRKDASLQFHGVPAHKVRGARVERTLPRGEEARAFVLAAQFLIEVDRAALRCVPNELDQSRALFATAGVLGM